MEKGLRKPEFQEISTISPGKHCYHVYGKVMEVNKKEKTKFNGETVSYIEGVIADESGCANFRFQSDKADIVKKGAIIAIRNGKSNVFDEHIVLEIDRFGKVSSEKVAINTVNIKNNISDTLWELKSKK